LKRPIKFPERFKQPIIFDGLQNGLVSPTDIDFCFEVDNTFLLIGDCKRGDAPFPTGQRLVIERIVDSWCKLGRLSLGMIATHNTESDNPVILADTNVTSIYKDREWLKSDVVFSILIKYIADKWNIDKLKNLS
tara:strand:+ start:395 stop:796 length:402 start_codon:yes stop_codon:yes gene_type:complete